MPEGPKPLPISMKRRVKAKAHEIFGATSVCDLYVRALRVRGAVVLMYHSVAPVARQGMQDPSMAVPEAEFEAQMSFLARRRKVVSLGTLVDQLDEGHSPEPGTVVITFDDGYLDNYEIAAPILERLRLPATIFVATGHISRTENMWIDDLCCNFKHRGQHRLALANTSFDLSVPGETDRAYHFAAGVLLRASVDTRAELMQSIERQLAPSCPPIRLMMNWDEVRALRKRFPMITIGSHTRNHVDLSSASNDVVVAELQSAHDDIKRELGIEVDQFAFPYGRDSASGRAWLRSKGYRAAMLTGPVRLVQADSDPIHLRRLEVMPGRTAGRFAYHTSGAHPSLSRVVFLGRA